MLSVAEETATVVRKIALNWFRHPLTIDTKVDESPVTIADRSVEQAIRRAIGARFPDHGILGEEYGLSHSDAEFVWSKIGRASCRERVCTYVSISVGAVSL